MKKKRPDYSAKGNFFQFFQSGSTKLKIFLEVTTILRYSQKNFEFFFENILKKSLPWPRNPYRGGGGVLKRVYLFQDESDRSDFPASHCGRRWDSVRSVRYGSVLTVGFARLGSHGSVHTVRFSRFASHGSVSRLHAPVQCTAQSRNVRFARLGTHGSKLNRK